jgi:predicted lipoprotein
VWQQAEVMQVGPAGIMGDVLGGDDVRDEIYSWPVTNICRVDQETLEEAHAAPEDLAKEAVNTRGLDAIEYLLFHPVSGNGCKNNSSINKQGTWKEMEADIPQRQAAYAASASSLVHDEAVSLLNRWKPSGKDYAATLKSAGEGSGIYTSVQEGLNAISDAMFYVEKTTKDMKLAEPLGYVECDEETCPDALESRYAHASKDAVIANLEGILLMFHGGADKDVAVGFDDLLHSYGASDLANQMSSKLANALEAVKAIPGPFSEALESDVDTLEAGYVATKEFTDLFKTQFLSVLDLEIPARAASDND